MRIAIIGGSGFIGTRLADRLLKTKHEVIIVDKVQSIAFPGIWKYGDVRHGDTLIAALEGCDLIYNLAAEHSDLVEPASLYYDVNVAGARNVCEAADELGITKIVFTSSVAVYGAAPVETDETGNCDPNNDYGRSKYLAEEVYRTWLCNSMDHSLVIVRPTVVFGENNRGNVYNLIRQIASGKFLMIGHGRNRKSMAYVENVAAFLEYLLIYERGEYIFNYIDKPDYDMNLFVKKINLILGRNYNPRFRVPYLIGLAGGYVFDFLSILTRRKLPISSSRIRKFSRDTHFTSRKVNELYFEPPVSIEEGLERTLKYEFK